MDAVQLESLSQDIDELEEIMIKVIFALKYAAMDSMLECYLEMTST
jgi:hypothetical protein